MALQPLIAIVDDDEGLRVSLDGLVRSLGYRVSTFSSAEAYLSSAVAAESACIISDVQMPGGMSGIRLAQKVKASSDPIPIILISAFVDERVSAEANAAGVHAFLRKPFDGEVLIDLVEEALSA
ncbi:Response regulator receiver domain-containing protein [Sphingobium sp. AP50]|uniref:response regulator transcription factor n=1 Tax=Sphingobium sp. AP50 TaxID=1884369 RepID=UPI0008BAA040|nr:response regulator [Sphingobium sp. AP50]SEJ82037.1 Response regulator receiver domain-containing protein [Sphingobium sp. AP50]